MQAEVQTKPLSGWGFAFNKPLIIAGPCSAETEEQVINSAIELSNYKIDVFRSGIWKPRTRPGKFEGAGTEGLSWLKEAGKITGIPVATEVANAKHAEEALKIGIDILWIGARTTVNPFSVQEIADVLTGVDIPVFIKNPINPDIELWIGALERINKAGVNRLAAIHRGFSTYGQSQYRNKPNWEIPIELKRRIPELDIICDPSHICGSREALQSVSQTAIDLNYSGLMIESHLNPDQAWSDADQQITPVQLGALLANLVYRKPRIEDVLTRTRIEELRDKINKVDIKLLNFIAERMELARSIGQYKLENNVTILQNERWTEIVNTRINTGLSYNLSEEFVLKLFEIIHQEAIRHQNNIMNPCSGDLQTRLKNL